MSVGTALRSPTSDDPAALPQVAASLNYIARMPEKPYNLTYDPPPGQPRTNAVYEPHPVTVYDARPIAGSLSLDREGFAIIEAPSAMRGFDDEAAIRDAYYPECERLVAEATGAKRVIVFDHTIRRREPSVEDRTRGAPRQPVTRVHNDYTETSGPQRVRDLMGAAAEELLKRRFAFINVWRPIVAPLLDTPLAACDARSVAFQDFVPSDLVYPDRRGETYAVAYSPAHRWFYFPAMRTDEAMLLKCYDSERDGTARFAPHAAFVDPTTPPDAPARESIEIRTIAFWG
jgi:hypothetical protein